MLSSLLLDGIRWLWRRASGGAGGFLDGFSTYRGNPSLGLTASFASGVGRGDRSLVLTDLARRGAGAGGGSFPAASKDDFPSPDGTKLSMNEAFFALSSDESNTGGLVRPNVVAGVFCAVGVFEATVLGGGGAGRRELC